MNGTATPALDASKFVAQPDGTCVYQIDAISVLSVQRDGSLQTRPLLQLGPWEKGRRVGNKWVVSDPSYPTGMYALLVV